MDEDELRRFVPDVRFYFYNDESFFRGDGQFQKASADRGVRHSPVQDLIQKLPFLVKDPATLNQRDYLRLSRFGGLQKGGVTEISGALGSGKTESVLKLVVENPELRVAWLEKEWTLYPGALVRGHAGQEALLQNLWCVEWERSSVPIVSVLLQIIASQTFGAVVIYASSANAAFFTAIDLRRLQISAEKANVAVIVLTERALAHGGWCFRKRFRVECKENRLEVNPYVASIA